jgi:hypothetical protein
VIASLRLKNLSGTHSLRFDWHDPKGQLYSTTGNRPIEASKGTYVKELTAWHDIALKG